MKSRRIVLDGSGPSSVGVLSLVMLSVLLRPLSLVASKSAAIVGAGGATVSIVTASGADAGPVKPLFASRATAVTVNAPLAANAAMTEYVPPTDAMPLPSGVVPFRRSTVRPGGAVPVNVALVRRVMLSVLLIPVSSAAIRSGALGGAGGVGLLSMLVNETFCAAANAYTPAPATPGVSVALPAGAAFTKFSA